MCHDSNPVWNNSYTRVWHETHELFVVDASSTTMGWLRLVRSLKLQVSFAKEPYQRDGILQKRPIILSILLTVATPYVNVCSYIYTHALCVTWHDSKYIWHDSYMCVTWPIHYMWHECMATLREEGGSGGGRGTITFYFSCSSCHVSNQTATLERGLLSLVGIPAASVCVCVCVCVWVTSACVWCNTVQHSATHCTTVLHRAPQCTSVHHTATHGNTRQ